MFVACNKTLHFNREEMARIYYILNLCNKIEISCNNIKGFIPLKKRCLTNNVKYEQGCPKYLIPFHLLTTFAKLNASDIC